jgi:hypothetical protein
MLPPVATETGAVSERLLERKGRAIPSVMREIIAAVPRIREFYGIVIEMYYGDHPPPHFHARYGRRLGKDRDRKWRGDRRVAARSRTAARARMDRRASRRARGQLGASGSPREAATD